MSQQTIICMKWGVRYDSSYVNRLYRSILDNTKRKTRLVCFTDDKRGVNENVDCQPLPKIEIPDELSFTPWRKMSVWQNPLHNLIGDVLFLDLDLLITGNLDKFFDFKKNEFCVIENWTQKGRGIGNTSCFRFPVGRNEFLFNQFEEQPFKILNKYKIEQVYISKEISIQHFWPEKWCKSFKHDLLPKWPFRIWKEAVPPEDASIVAFTGRPDPEDVLRGKWPVETNEFYKKIYKQLKTPKWLVNVWKE